MTLEGLKYTDFGQSVEILALRTRSWENQRPEANYFLGNRTVADEYPRHFFGGLELSTV